MIDLIRYLMLGYAALGLTIGPLFVFYLANRWVPGAKGSGFIFRVFVLPGAVLLWPFIVVSIPQLRRDAL